MAGRCISMRSRRGPCELPVVGAPAAGITVYRNRGREEMRSTRDSRAERGEPPAAPTILTTRDGDGVIDLGPTWVPFGSRPKGLPLPHGPSRWHRLNRAERHVNGIHEVADRRIGRFVRFSSILTGRAMNSMKSSETSA